MEKNRDEYKSIIVKLGSPISDGNGKIAEYMQTTRLVRISNESNEELETIMSETCVFWGATKAQLLLDFNAEKEDATPSRVSVLNSLIATLEAE